MQHFPRGCPLLLENVITQARTLVDVALAPLQRTIINWLISLYHITMAGITICCRIIVLHSCWTRIRRPGYVHRTVSRP
jgi:hypothetical protein